jgi:hypothetical protein
MMMMMHKHDPLKPFDVNNENEKPYTFCLHGNDEKLLFPAYNHVERRPFILCVERPASNEDGKPLPAP